MSLLTFDKIKLLPVDYRIIWSPFDATNAPLQIDVSATSSVCVCLCVLWQVLSEGVGSWVKCCPLSVSGYIRAPGMVSNAIPKWWCPLLFPNENMGLCWVAFVELAPMNNKLDNWAHESSTRRLQCSNPLRIHVAAMWRDGIAPSFVSLYLFLSFRCTFSAQLFSLFQLPSVFASVDLSFAVVCLSPCRHQTSTFCTSSPVTCLWDCPSLTLGTLTNLLAP